MNQGERDQTQATLGPGVCQGWREEVVTWLILACSTCEPPRPPRRFTHPLYIHWLDVRRERPLVKGS